MSELPAKLRTLANGLTVFGWVDSAEMCRETADELERLQSEIERLQSWGERLSGTGRWRGCGRHVPVACANERQGSCRGFKTPSDAGGEE